jgi:hypothetical protein
MHGIGTFFDEYDREEQQDRYRRPELGRSFSETPVD